MATYAPIRPTGTTVLLDCHRYSGPQLQNFSEEFWGCFRGSSL
jgi:hypothetical protein